MLCYGIKINHTILVLLQLYSAQWGGAKCGQWQYEWKVYHFWNQEHVQYGVAILNYNYIKQTIGISVSGLATRAFF